MIVMGKRRAGMNSVASGANGVSYEKRRVLRRSAPSGKDQAEETERALHQVYDVGNCMTKSIRSFALLALICAVFPLRYIAAADGAMPPVTQAASSGSSDNAKPASVSTLVEYACKKGTHQKGARAGLVSVVMQRGSDAQPTRVVGVKDSKTGEVAFIHVLDSDCSEKQPLPAAPEASLALAHKAAGQEEYFYAVSDQAACLRAFQIKFLGQFVPVDSSLKMQDCQNEVQSWLSMATRWKTQASSPGTAKH
jgi:hypothetical protein